MLIAVGNTVTFGGLTLGQTDTNGVEWYFTGLDGWGAPASTATPTQRAAGDGGYASAAFYAYRTITITGNVLAPTPAQLVAAQGTLFAAASILVQPVTIVDSGQSFTVNGQRLDQPAWSRDSDISASFSLVFLCLDPRKFGAPIPISTGLPSGSGGWTFPFTFPLAINSTIVTGQCTAFNPGNMAGPVVATITGPVVGPQITHVASGATLTFSSSLALGPTEFIVVDMENHTVLAQGQASRAPYVTSRGWSRFDPGNNTWTFGAVSGSGNLNMIVTPAWQ